MKVNHHQIKNAIAHVSKLVQKDFPNKKYELRWAWFESYYWMFEVSLQSYLQSSSIKDRPSRYYVKLEEIGSSESISLDNLFIETYGIGKVVDAGWGFMNHADKISTAMLIRYILPTHI